MSASAKADDPSEDRVHRLIRMLVEEVSLVDRPANQRPFLIIKRNDDMTTENATVEVSDDEFLDADLSDDATTADVAGAPQANPALDAALAALESVSTIVELLGSIGAASTDSRLTDLAEQLHKTSEEVLARAEPAAGTVDESSSAGTPPVTETAAEVTAANAGQSESTASTSSEKSFTSHMAAAKKALARLSEVTRKAVASNTAASPAVAATEPPASTAASATPPASTPPDTGIVESLAKLADSFRQLSDTVRDQQQRLAKIEKQHASPNSTPVEPRSNARVENVGWPLDLNKPLGRDHVDKSVSFHDIE